MRKEIIAGPPTGFLTDQIGGFGASAISRFPAGYAQNVVAFDEYARCLNSNGLATARGRHLTRDDQIRAFVIQRLMCTFSFSARNVADRFGYCPKALLDDAAAVIANDAEGFVGRTADGFRRSQRGQPFVRSMCAVFDAYLTSEIAHRRHAMAV